MVQCCFTSTETVGSNRRRLSRQREREIDRENYSERERQRHRQTDRQTQTDRQKETHRERQIHTDSQPIETESGNKKTIGRDKPQSRETGRRPRTATSTFMHLLSSVILRSVSASLTGSQQGRSRQRRRKDDGGTECRSGTVVSGNAGSALVSLLRVGATRPRLESCNGLLAPL